MTYATKNLTDIIDDVTKTAVGFIDAATSVIDGVNSIVSLPKTVQSKALNLATEIQNATKGLVKAVDDLSKTCRNAFSFSSSPESFGLSGSSFDPDPGDRYNGDTGLIPDTESGYPYEPSSQIPQEVLGACRT